MKPIIACAVIIHFINTISLTATTVNGRFVVVSADSSKFSVIIQINTDTGTDDLGGTTMLFSYDTTVIYLNDNPIRNTDYIFHNFSEGNYSSATVTRPVKNQVWVNIDLPFINSNNGTVVEASPGWTNVVTIHFSIIDPNGSAHLSWLKTSPFWGIYDADNTTLWQTGEFEDLFGPIPVELVSFRGTLLQNGFVLLEWQTVSALNHLGFEIQKSYRNIKEWVTIGFTESYGEPGSLVEYSFIDHSPHKFPNIRYRLKSIDNDGSSQFSETIEINESPVAYELLQNYPNPFNPSTTIRFSLPEATIIKLNLYNMIGELVSTLAEGMYETGHHSVTFEASNLPSGTYFYRLESASFTQSRKMLLIK